MITIYCSKITTRIEFVANFIYKDLLNIEYRITDNVNSIDGLIVNYSLTKLPISSYHIKPAGLMDIGALFSPDVISCEYEKIKLYPSDSDDHGFDLFSAVFYLITRMEECFSENMDEHGRYLSSESLLVKHQVNQYPVVDIWCVNFLSRFNKFFSKELALNRKYTQFITIDIDNAYAFQYKGFTRTIASTARDLLLLKKSKLIQRWNLWVGKSKDPYDTYDFIVEYIKENKIRTICFFLLGDYGDNDKNISAMHPAMKSLIKRMSSVAEIGIHPSYGSFLYKHILAIELKRLENIVGDKVELSRFHYLRFQIPRSYINLIDSGVAEDYSMGYSDQIGFRAGTCTVFNYYDLNSEETTSLRLVPFAYMDGVLKDRMQLSAEDAILTIKQLKNEVQKVGGLFTAVWHNESLSDKDRWNGWKSVFNSSWT